MIGISAYGGEQFRAAAQGHPALKAIYPYDSMGGYSGMWSVREFHPRRRVPDDALPARHVQLRA